MGLGKVFDPGHELDAHLPESRALPDIQKFIDHVIPLIAFEGFEFVKKGRGHFPSIFNSEFRRKRRLS